MRTRPMWGIVGCMLLFSCRVKQPAEERPGSTPVAEKAPALVPEKAPAAPAVQPTAAVETPEAVPETPKAAAETPKAAAEEPPAGPAYFEGEPLPALPVVFETDFEDGKLDRWEATDAKAWRIEDVEAGDAAERSHARHCLLRFARRLSEKGNTAEAVKVCRGLLTQATPRGGATPAEASIASAAFYQLTGLLDGDEAIVEVARGVGSEIPAVRIAAIRAAKAMRGKDVTQRLADALATGPPDSRAPLLQLLRQRGDAAALPAVLRALRDDEKAVRVAAIAAAGALGKRDVAPQLIGLLDRGGEEAEAARGSLAGMGDEGLDGVLVEALGTGSPGVREGLLVVLAARNVGAHRDVFLRHARDEDGRVRHAALKILGTLGDEEVITGLMDVLAGTADREEQGVVERALLQACRKLSDKSHRKTAELLIGRYGKADAHVRRALLQALCCVAKGYPGGLAAVRAALKDADPAVRSAAVRALSDWPGTEPTDELLDIARTTEDETQHVLALRGYIRMTGALGSSKKKADQDKAVECYRAALAAARRPTEKKQVLGAASGMKHPGALGIAVSCLGDPELKTEAVAAAIKIGSAIRDRHGPAVAEAMQQVLKTARTPEEKRLIEAAMEEEQIADVKVSTDKKCELVRKGLKPGALVYTDRGYKYEAVPDALVGATYFKTANEDRGASGKEYLTFTVSKPVTVYVGYDNRAKKRPAWLRDWQDTGQSVRTTDHGCRPKLYSKPFPAGTVKLGGNNAPGASSHYVVIIGK